MTDDRFDELAKALSRNTSRRGVLKGVIAAAFGGVLLRAGGGEASATRARRACSRLGEACGGANPPSCPGLVCDNGVALRPDDAPCLQDSDCCCGEVCRPHGAFAYRCRAGGVAGDQCADDADCAAGYTCDPAGATCLGVEGTTCQSDADCASGNCDAGSLTCASCVAAGGACLSDADCCAGDCDPYTLTCGGCAGEGAPCLSDGECCAGVCDPLNLVCGTPCLADGLACGADDECCSGTCDSGTGTCGGAVCPPQQVCGADCCIDGYFCCGGMCCPTGDTCCQSVNTGVPACYNPNTECCPGMIPCGENVNYPGTGIPQCCDGVGVTCCNGHICCPADWTCCPSAGCNPPGIPCV